VEIGKISMVRKYRHHHQSRTSKENSK
jgi:hypothetical protein